jgi:hypothetical protein
MKPNNLCVVGLLLKKRAWPLLGHFLFPLRSPAQKWRTFIGNQEICHHPCIPF